MTKVTAQARHKQSRKAALELVVHALLEINRVRDSHMHLHMGRLSHTCAVHHTCIWLAIQSLVTI